MESNELVIPKQLTELSENNLPTLKEVKDWYIEKILNLNNGNKTKSSEKLGISIRTIRLWDNRNDYSVKRGGKCLAMREKMKRNNPPVVRTIKEDFEFRCHHCNKLIMKEERGKAEIQELKLRSFSCCPEHVFDPLVIH